MPTSAPLFPLTAADPQGPAVPWPRVEQFVSQFTHDVRNGLNALELQLTLLGEISEDPEVASEVKAVRGALTAVTRQLQTVKALTEGVSPHLLTYPAADFFEDLKERFTRLYPKAGEQIAWKLATADVALEIDPELSLSALLELLGNALHFGGSAATIGLEAAVTDGGNVAVTLRESKQEPPAVAPADWGRSPFLTTRRGGYGLGLFRVRRILEAQGGSLEADYAAPDNVLTVTAVLPGTSPAL